MRVWGNNRQPYQCLTVLLSALAAFALSACTPASRLPAIEINGNTMGTSFSVLVVNPSNTLQLDNLRSSIVDELERIDTIASTYGSLSELSKLNANDSGGLVKISPALCGMIRDAILVSTETGGAFDITMGPLVNLWGFGPDPYVSAPPSDTAIDAAIANTGYQHLKFDCQRNTLQRSLADMEIDLSGWAKGHAADQLAQLLIRNEVANFLVEVGGEITVLGSNAQGEPFSVGLESPIAQDSLSLPVVRLLNQSVATSGNYRNYFEFAGIRYSHTIDPRNGQPTRHALSAVTVVHDSAAYADAMATALLVLGPDDGLSLANELEIAAYFAINTADGIKYESSSAFVRGAYLARD